jgi:antitoxin VapB
MLTIRDPRAALLARKLAKIRNITMTAAVIAALEQEVRREQKSVPLTTRIRGLAHKARAMAGPKGHIMTRDEIDALSGL